MYQRKSDFSCQQHGRSLITERIWIREIAAFTGSNELGSEVITWISISHALDCIWLPTIAFSPNVNYDSVTLCSIVAKQGFTYVLMRLISMLFLGLELRLSLALLCIPPRYV